MILVVASMGIRVGMLVGLSIPFCFLLTFIVLNIANIEFNFLVMMGLLLGLGMLIDGSIVVTEYADRKISEGVQRIEAYRLASKRMFYPILSSTATTIAAFTPLIFGQDSRVNLCVFTNRCFHSSISFIGLCNDCSASSWCCIWSKKIFAYVWRI